MRRMATAPVRPRQVVLGRLLVPPGPMHPSTLLADEAGRCVVCEAPVTPVVISCPACRQKHRAHTRDQFCREGRCAGHPRDEEVRALSEVDSPDQERIRAVQEGPEFLSAQDGLPPAHAVTREATLAQWLSLIHI